MDMMLSVEDLLDIQELMVRYATGIDSRRWTLFRSCFTDGARADYHGFGSFTDADELTATMEAAHAPMGATLHRMSNIAIEASGGQVAVRTYVDAVLTAEQRDGTINQATGYYDDVVVKTDTGWKIASRTFTFVRFQQSIDPPPPF